MGKGQFISGHVPHTRLKPGPLESLGWSPGVGSEGLNLLQNRRRPLHPPTQPEGHRHKVVPPQPGPSSRGLCPSGFGVLRKDTSILPQDPVMYQPCLSTQLTPLSILVCFQSRDPCGLAQTSSALQWGPSSSFCAPLLPAYPLKPFSFPSSPQTPFPRGPPPWWTYLRRVRWPQLLLGAHPIAAH